MGPHISNSLVQANDSGDAAHDFLVKSTKAEPPPTFDGQAPEFAFSESKTSRWIIGNNYQVLGPAGDEVIARLQSASASIESKKMIGVFLFEDKNFVVESPMTDPECAAYIRSPETFFGVVQSVGGRVNNVAELAEFFYASYRDTPKEKLLEFLKDHPSFEQLVNLNQTDLAIFVCEQWALAADQNGSTPENNKPRDPKS